MMVLTDKGLLTAKEKFQALSAGEVAIWIFFLAALVYANSFPSVFIMDDLHIVANNPLVKNFDLWKIFTSDYWNGIENTGLYRPLTILSFALNRLTMGAAPWGYHLVNVALHAAIAAMLWLVLLHWQMPRVVALTAALLFLAHPIHTEAINIVVGRSELLVALFLLLALLLARMNARHANLAVFLSYFLALLSKEHAIVLLALLPLLDAFVAGSWSAWRQRWTLYAGLIGVTVGWLLMRQYFVQQSGVPSPYSPVSVPLAYLPWGERVLTALQYQGIYLLKLMIPYKLQAVYSLADLPRPVTSVFSVQGLGVVAGMIGTIALVVVGWHRRQLWALFLACYFVSFAPTANIFIPIGVTFAERLAYLPSIWYCATCGAILHVGMEQNRLKAACRLFVIIYCLGLTLSTFVRNFDFSSEIRLWGKEVQNNRNDYLGWLTFAEVLENNRRYEEAERAMQYVLNLQPDFQGALRSYAFMLLKQKRFVEALTPANHTLDISRKIRDKTGIAHDSIALAQIYVELGDFDQALRLLMNPESMQLDNLDSYYSLLGRAHAGRKEDALAVDAYRKVNVYSPEQKIPFYLGLSLLRLGKLEEARVALEEVERSVRSAEEWNLLGTIYAQKSQYNDAVAAFAVAVELNPGNDYYKNNLSRARQSAVGDNPNR